MSQGSAIHLTSQDLSRFFSKIQVNRQSQCWEWTASLTPQGYAQVSFRGKPAVAHRISYRAFVGVIPEGLVIDHLCNNRRCVNPCHLKAVTHQENIIRGTAPTAVLARTNTCRKGHSFTPETTMVRKKTGVRTCRICFNEWHRNRSRSHRAEKALSDKSYRERNAEKISARRKAARTNRLEECRAKDREWSRAHRERKKQNLHT